MGLDISHGAWSGSYSTFHAWRCEVANAAGFPNWDCPKTDPLTILLNHSDCDGEISWEDCKDIADRLIELMPKIDEEVWGNVWKRRTRTQCFIDGLMLAHSKQENLEFC